MRKFTKKHNDINWLFPKVTEYYNPEHTFDEFEEIGQDLLELGYDNQETFTQDDMMDAFMKGASVMNQILGERVAQDKALKQELDTIKAIGMADEEVARAEERERCIKVAQDVTCRTCECSCREEDKHFCPLYSAIHNDIMKGGCNDD